MKICVDCIHSKKEVIQVSPTQMGSVLICTHSECRDPVSGDHMPCTPARQMLVMCGFEGKMFEPKPKEAPVEKTVENVIILK